MKKYISIILSLISVLSLCSCSADTSQRFSATLTDYFDTVVTVIAYDKNQKSFDEHLESFERLLKEYDRLYDIYNPYDDTVNIYSLNELAKESPIKVDKRIIDLLSYCKDVYYITEKRVNICLGAVLELWHAEREKASESPESAKLPDTEELKEASRHTDIDSLVIDYEELTVYYSDPYLKLDVGAVAKGYAAKRICEYAEESLWKNAAISFGGNVVTFGHKENGNKWNIEIENPDQTADGALETLSITDMSIVTSGDYQRYYTVDGKRYCHIIDAQTLMPADRFSSVTVISKDSALADALSTALFILPLEDGKKLIEETEDTEALWADKNFNKTYSSHFSDYIKKV